MSTSRPFMTHIEHVSINYADSLGSNYLQYNSTVGVFAAQGAVDELQAYVAAMQPKYINSFLGGTCYVTRLEEPLLVYRTGGIGKYWSLTPPSSPLQQALDLAMPVSIYPELPVMHPANKGVLMYEIPAGQIVVTGKCAPMGGFPGQTTQVYLHQVDASAVRGATWSEWLQHQRSPLAFTGHWQECQLGNLGFKFENVRAHFVLQNVMPRVFRNPSSTFQTVLSLAQQKSLQGSLQLYAYDLASVESNAAGLTYYYTDGARKVLLQTKNPMGLYREFTHEITHATLPLSSNIAVDDPLYGKYAPRMRQAICTDFWDYKRMGNAAPIQERAANWIFAKPHASIYLKADRLPERLAYTVQAMAESEMAARSVAPRTFRVVQEYVAEHAATAATPKPGFTAQTVKIWDAKHSCVSSYLKNPAQPSAFITLPWYKNINYTMVGQCGLTAIMPPLLALDASNRLTVDRMQFPDYSEAAHYGAVATDMAVDAALFARSIKFGSPCITMPLFTLLNINAEIANGIRHVPAEAMMNNRDFLQATISFCEFSPELEQMLLDDFDNGGTMSRKLNIAGAQNAKFSYKPFQWYYDMKKSAANLVRDVFYGVSAQDFLVMDDFGHPTRSLPRSEAPKKQDIPEIIEIAEAIDERVREPIAHFHEMPTQLPTAPLASGALNPQATYHGSVNLVENSDHHLALNLGMGGAVMTPDFHHYLNAINETSGAERQELMTATAELAPAVPPVNVPAEPGIGSTGSSQERDKKEEKPDVPFISNVRLGKVGDKLGVVATVAGMATVGVAAEKGGFAVVIAAEFGPQFWTAMGAGLGVGAAVAAVLLAAKFFMDRHQKHVQHKINSGIKSTNKDGARLNDGLQRLFKGLNQPVDADNLASLLQQSEALMAYIRGRVKKEQDRGDYARSHRSGDAKKAHRGAEKTYKSVLYDLNVLTRSLKLEQAQLDFIKAHTNADCSSLIALASGLITKFSSKQAAAAASEKDNAQPDPMARIDSYHNQGYRLYKFEQDRKGRGHTKGHHLTSAEAKQHILNGGQIEVKKGHAKDWISMPAKTYTDTELAQIGGVRVLIVGKILELVQSGHNDEALALLDSTRLLHEYGTTAADLKLSGLHTLLSQLVSQSNRSPAYWIGELQSVNAGTRSLSDEDKLLLKGMASHELMNQVINNALQGKFETANAILQALKVELPDNNDTADKLIAKFRQLQPHLENTDECLRLLGVNKADASRANQLDSAVEDAILTFAIKKDIFGLVSEGKFDEAAARYAEFKGVMAQDAEPIDGFADGIQQLKALKGKPCDQLLAAITASTNNEFVTATLRSWVFGSVFKNVLHGNKKEAARDLTALKEKDPAQGALCDRLINKITASDALPDNDADFLLTEYTRVQAEQKALPEADTGSLETDTSDPHAGTVLNMEKTIILGGMFNIVGDKGKRGFNREAANLVARMQANDAALNLLEMEEDFRFAHREQVIGIFVKPVQEMAVRYVRGFAPSRGRTVALFGLGVVSTVQIVAPSSLSIAMQAAHARCFKQNMCPAIRNKDALLTQLNTDLNPFAKDFKLLNTANYCNGAMIYAQLALKVVEYFPLSPLNWMLSEKRRYQAEVLRSNFVSNAGMGIRVAYTTTAFLQIKSAVQLTGGLFSLASAPSLMVTLGNAAFDAGCWANYKYLAGRGVAPENPGYYMVQEGVSASMDTLGAIAFTGFITGGLGWLALGVGVFCGSVSVHRITCEATKKDTSAKALMAACSNISYHRNLQSIFQYIHTVKFKIMQQVPSLADLDKVTSRSEMIVRKQGKYFTLYFASDDKKGWRLRRINSCHEFLENLAWPDEKNVIVLEDEAMIKTLQDIAKDAIINEPIMDEYTKTAAYTLIKGKPDQLEPIKNGKLIVFAQNNKDYSVYVMNQSEGYDEVAITDQLACFELLKDNDKYEVKPDSPYYREMLEFATGCVVNQRLRASNHTIDKLLTSVFGGRAYVSGDPDQEAANFSRIAELYQLVKDAYDQKQHQVVIESTDIFIKNCKTFINAEYQLPPHLAWQMILYFRLTTYIETPGLLKEFRDQFQYYVNLISTSALEEDCKPWYYAHFESVKKSLEQVLGYAMQQFIIAASHAVTVDEKLLLLSFVTKTYESCADWFLVLDNDELKFVAASIYYSLNMPEERKLFMNHIKDKSGFLRNKNDREVTSSALAMLIDDENVHYNEILRQAARGELPIEDQQLLINILASIERKAFTAARQILDASREFQGKRIAEASLHYAVSGNNDLLGTLKILMREQTKSLHYWLLMEALIARCLNSVKYSPHQPGALHANAKLWGWRKICMDHIKRFEITFDMQKDAAKIIEQAMEHIRFFVRAAHQQSLSLSAGYIESQVEHWIELGHQSIRGENGIKMQSELESIMNDISYTYTAADENHKYLPLDVPADENCAFHMFNITPKEGLAILDKHTGVKPDLKDTRAVMTVLAQVLKKNIRIFSSNSDGVINITSCSIYSADFDTVDVLHLSNNYIRLQKMTAAVVEVVDSPRTSQQGMFGNRQRETVGQGTRIQLQMN